MDPIDALGVLRLVPELFQITRFLEAAAPGRHFTPDGHLVGSIGEAVAAARYGLELTTASTKGVDAHHRASDKSVEIKATVEGKRIALPGMTPEADHLLVLRINGDGSANEVYNGPAAPVWAAAGRIQSNGQRVVSVSRLMALQSKVSPDQKLQQRVDDLQKDVDQLEQALGDQG